MSHPILDRHGKSFSFATRLMPAGDRALVADAYAFCRTVDDLVDSAADTLAPHALHHALDLWLARSRAAYAGELVEPALISRAMRTMHGHGVPFHYVEELVAGMRMDIGAVRYEDLSSLTTYTHRVAGVVGLWMANLFGVHEPWMLERAAGLGRAMQLTNIVRDVGADWDIGRVYLPQSMLRSYGLDDEQLGAMRTGRRPLSPGFRATLETLMTIADASYARAFEAIPALPIGFRRAVAVAAEVYQGIHVEVRRNGYDTLTRRAATSRSRKWALAVRALRRVGQARRGRHAGGVLVGST